MTVPEPAILADRGAPGRRRAGRLALAAGAAFLGLAALSSFLPGGGGQGGGSPSSSYSNRPGGTSAWAELLSRFGHPVERVRRDLDTTTLDPITTVVVLDAPGLSPAEADALGAFVRQGGRLVAGGSGANGWLASVVDRPPVPDRAGVATAVPVGSSPAPEVLGLRTVRAGRLGSWSDPGELAPILAGGDGRVIAVAGRSGLGRVVALADPSPVQNELLAADDNAALALGLVGESAHRPVLFAEGVHGYGDGEGLAALPRRWRLTLAGLGVAAAIWLVARSRRLGPPEDEARPLPPPRWAYVDAVAGTLSRTGRPGEAAEPVRQRARELIAGRAGLPSDAGPEELHAAAIRLGLPPDEAAAVVGAPATVSAATIGAPHRGAPARTGEAGVLAAGRALARLLGGER